MKYEQKIPQISDWEKCAVVLDKREAINEMMKGW
jgi:hypothetical protein